MKDVSVFLGICGFYKRFVAFNATVAAPLKDVIQKGKEWVWVPVQQNVFETLKARPLQATVVIHTHHTNHYILHTQMRQMLVWEPHFPSWTLKVYPDRCL